MRAKLGVEAQIKRFQREARIQARGHSWKNLAKNLPVFCPCPGNLHKTKLKFNGLISLVEEISGVHNIESMVWSLLISLMQAYGEKEQISKKEICTIYLKNTRKLNAVGNAFAERETAIIKEISR